MADILGNLDDFIISMWESAWTWINQKIMEGLTWLLQLTLNPAQDFWNDSLIISLIRTGKKVGRLVFVIALLAMLFDIVEDLSADKQVYLSTVIGNIFKGLLFIELAPVIGKYSILICDAIATSINLSQYVGSMSGNQFHGIVMIIGFIACIVYLYHSLRRFGSMLVQILSCPLYIPSIVRGDTTAMGSWIRQTVAISLTFLFQYILFYLSLVQVLRGSFLIAVALWIGVAATPRLLDKYALSGGSGGGMASAGYMVMQGASMFIR